MVPLLSLLATLSMTTIMLLIPILIETATKWEQATRFLFAKNIGIFLIWILLLVSVDTFYVIPAKICVKCHIRNFQIQIFRILIVLI